jgi:predicted permease
MRQWTEEALTDLRYALRMLRKAPIAAATIILCLGFSVGATGTVFTWTDSILSTPTPHVRDAERLVSFRAGTETRFDGLSYPELRDVADGLRDRGNRNVASVAAHAIRRFLMRIDAGTNTSLAEPVWGSLVTANYLDVLGVRPHRGRFFRAGEDSTRGAGTLAVISYGLWQRRFGGEEAVVGRRIRINNVEHEIIGVAPEGFIGNVARLGIDIWIPLSMQPRLVGSADLLDLRKVHWLDAFGRLAPESSREAANAEVRDIGAVVASRYAGSRGLDYKALTFDIGPVSFVADLFVVLLSLTELVLLVVCSNIANLLLLRGAAREHEVAVRLAMGARRGRLVRQLLTESLVLAVAGIVLATGITAWGRNALTAFAPDSPLPLVMETTFAPAAFVKLVLVGLAMVLGFGLVPALRATRVPVRASLGGGTRGGSARGGALRGALVSAQFALSLTVLVMSAMFMRKLNELERVDRGFRKPEEVLLATLDFEMSGVHGDTMPRVLSERIVKRMRSMPGVQSAAAASFVPLGFTGYASTETKVDGYVPREEESMSFLFNAVSSDYFTTMGIAIEAGRPIDESDQERTLPVAVVNAAFVRRFWPGQPAIGRKIHVEQGDLTIVGVAQDGKYEYLEELTNPSPPFIYVSLNQWRTHTVVLHARATPPGNPLALMPAVQRIAGETDARLSAISPSTLDRYSSVPYLPVRMTSGTLAILGFGALILATLGLYAVMGYAVAQRKREIGIRMALGAAPGRLVRRFVATAGVYVGIGALVGTALTLAIVRVVGAKLPGALPVTIGEQAGPFFAAAGVLGVVAAFAAFIPANRASRVSPTVVLREE